MGMIQQNLILVERSNYGDILPFVYLGPEENIEFAIKKFRKEVERESILRECKERQRYRKPSLVRREAKMRLEKRMKRRERRRVIDR